MENLTHLDNGGHPMMVDVGSKDITSREAEAVCYVILPPSVLEIILSGTIAKGDVLKFAELAGISGCKKTSDLIPLCHNIRIDSSTVRCTLEPEMSRIEVKCIVKASEVTGVEMESLTGAMVAALTIYDMCKALDKGITITNLRLLRKTGGKSGSYMAKGDVE